MTDTVETKRLPDAEYDVMEQIWAAAPPVTTAVLMDKVGRDHGWKAPTLISFLVRLEERGFIRSEKKGKERHYYPVVERDCYIRAITWQFIHQYHNGSYVHILTSLFGDTPMNSDQLEEMLTWLQNYR